MAKAKKILDIIRSILSLSFRLQKLISPIHSKQYMYVIQTGKSLKPRFEGLTLGIKQGDKAIAIHNNVLIS